LTASFEPEPIVASATFVIFLLLALIPLVTLRLPVTVLSPVIAAPPALTVSPPAVTFAPPFVTVNPLPMVAAPLVSRVAEETFPEAVTFVKEGEATVLTVSVFPLCVMLMFVPSANLRKYGGKSHYIQWWDESRVAIIRMPLCFKFTIRFSIHYNVL